ncbi:type II toxin-antitoxin system RelE/ParE family toxin [uncultured Stenotrophomonas sp.]|uniref:type II toxin-antitoxin system RelE/ParE family toxin n=1 Tax=uncultured Stenotrophomonas sp. TaxID=165438 RepID=UPI0028D76B67|nr:type II toxin-antitoxin system RelE/ParE family toxin [uncultured Stenotrophomonas sp.]
MNTIEHYLTADQQRDPYMEWLRRMRNAQARIAVIRRIARIEHGNFGDQRFCRDGVWELRVDVGQGYRVYYGMSGQSVVLLLCGGDKRTQDTDIKRAVQYWQDWNRRIER